MVESVSRLNHDRGSGALELLLVTPLSIEAIMAAQKASLKAHFACAFFILALLNVALASAIYKYRDAVQVDVNDRWMFMELFVGGLIVLLADSEASLWVGMWQGLSKRQSYKAVAITALQLLGPCWLLAFFSIVTQMSFGSRIGVATTFAMWFLIGLIVDALSIRLARFHLNKRFREVAAQRYGKPE